MAREWLDCTEITGPRCTDQRVRPLCRSDQPLAVVRRVASNRPPHGPHRRQHQLVGQRLDKRTALRANAAPAGHTMPAHWLMGRRLQRLCLSTQAEGRGSGRRDLLDGSLEICQASAASKVRSERFITFWHPGRYGLHGVPA